MPSTHPKKLRIATFLPFRIKVPPVATKLNTFWLCGVAPTSASPIMLWSAAMCS